MEAKEMLREMQACEFIYDTSIGKFFNRKHEIYKMAVIEILDVLYLHFDRVKYVDDLSYLKDCALLFSEKFARNIPTFKLPQLPFHLMLDGKNKFSGPCDAYFIVKDYLENRDGPVYVSLNFRNQRLRQVYHSLLQPV